MMLFKKLHDQGDINDELYEVVETRLAFKYGLSICSILRMRLKDFSNK